MSVEFLATSLVVILLPGSGVLYTLAFALGQGLRASVFAAVGCTLGVVPHLFASIVGLAAVLHASATAYEILRFLGVGYLFYLAWQAWRAGGGLSLSEGAGLMSGRRIILNGFLLNILNPKLSLFFLAFLPQFVPVDGAATGDRMAALGGVFMGLTFLVFVGYGAFASAARRYVISRPATVRWLQCGFAAAFGLLGVRLLIGER